MGQILPHHPLKEPILLTPWFQTSGLLSCKTIHFCCFKLSRLWSLLQQPQETNVPALLIHVDFIKLQSLEGKDEMMLVHVSFLSWRNEFQQFFDGTARNTEKPESCCIIYLYFLHPLSSPQNPHPNQRQFLGELYIKEPLSHGKQSTTLFSGIAPCNSQSKAPIKLE